MINLIPDIRLRLRLLHEVLMRNSSCFKNEASRSHLHKDSINMDDEEAMIFLSYILLKRRFHRKAERKAQKKRSLWVRQIYRQWEKSGIYYTLVQEMPLGDRETYFK